MEPATQRRFHSHFRGATGILDNGVQQNAMGIISVASAATTANIFKDENATAFLASGNKRAPVGFITYEF
jgi:hypothetical protein